jgi:lysophospholipase L1-like esterase
MDWYEDEVRGLEAAVRDRPPPPAGVAFYGSSSVRLWHTLAADFPGQAVVNLGFGGSTLAACAHFFPRLVPPCRPRAVVLYAGDNDLGDGRAPEDVLAALRSLVGRFAAALPAARLAVLAIKPSLARWHLQPRIVEANRLFAAELAGRPGARYVDVHAPMLGPDGRPRTDLYAADGLHLSAAGYRVWAGVIGRERWIFAPSSSELPTAVIDRGHGG